MVEFFFLSPVFQSTVELIYAHGAYGRGSLTVYSVCLCSPLVKCSRDCEAFKYTMLPKFIEGNLFLKSPEVQTFGHVVLGW